jgi:hypothetical protein
MKDDFNQGERSMKINIDAPTEAELIDLMSWNFIRD